MHNHNLGGQGSRCYDCLEADRDLWKSNYDKLKEQHLITERAYQARYEIWKGKAEKLAEALKNIESNYDCECVVGDRLRGAHKCQGCWAKEALAEFEKESK